MLYLLTALPAEARPLREKYRLAARPEAGPFAHFAGDGVELLQTGIGKTAMAAGCGWLAGRAAAAPGLWLNVGIAGHRSLPLGSPLLAHQVLDRATGRTFYPPLVFAPPCATGTVETVDRPELDYPQDHAYDMEASAFVEIAQKVAGAELAHVLKVVSDRCREDIAALDRAAVGAKIESLLPLIDQLRAAAEPLLEIERAGLAEPEDFEILLAQAHFTWSDKNELRRLLRRRAALAPETTLPPEIASISRGRELNRRLAAWLDRQPLLHGPPQVPGACSPEGRGGQGGEDPSARQVPPLPPVQVPGARPTSSAGEAEGGTPSNLGSPPSPERRGGQGGEVPAVGDPR